MASISYDHVTILRLQRGKQDKYWKGDLRGSTLSIVSGEAGTAGQTETRTFPTPWDAYSAMADEELDKERRGYHSIPPEQLDDLMKPQDRSHDEPAATGSSAGDGDRFSSLTKGYETSPAVRRSTPPAAPRSTSEIKREGPYAEAFTGPTIHIPKLGPTKKQGQGDDPHRATSGGRPILAEGQPWPACAYCEGRPLGLYLQFDVEERFSLALSPGSHFLLFHCTACNTPPPMPPDLTLPQSWLEAEAPSSYRIIVNPPTAREVAHPPDPIMREQHVTFSSAKETLGKGLNGSVGKRKFKIGGIPHWIQPPTYPKCACGAPMGFVMQVPTTELPGWATVDNPTPPFAGGLDSFIFACVAQSHPYAAMMVVQR